MIIVSQNLTNYDIPLPKNVVFRINLAWCDRIKELEIILEKHPSTPIFLDLPIKRIKPPNNKYTIEDLIPVIKLHKQIRYFAISNVESDNDIKKYTELLPKDIVIVPKIESTEAVDNLENIETALTHDEKILMLDHDDLFANILKKNESVSKFKEYIKTLVEFCDEKNIKLLRTVGVIFSDGEKRVSQYIN